MHIPTLEHLFVHTNVRVRACTHTKHSVNSEAEEVICGPVVFILGPSVIIRLHDFYLIYYLYSHLNINFKWEVRIYYILLFDNMYVDSWVSGWIGMCR